MGKLTIQIGLLLAAVLVCVAASGCHRKRPQGFYVKNGNPVYETRRTGGPGSGLMVRPVDADPKTFRPVARASNATEDSLDYALDDQHVFLGWSSLPLKLELCDPNSFRVISRDGKYSADATHVYYCGVLLENASPVSFSILAAPYSKDSKNVFAGTRRIEEANAEGFEVVYKGFSGFPLIRSGMGLVHLDSTTAVYDIYGWGRDGTYYYCGDEPLVGGDYDTLEVLNLLYAKDHEHVYFCRHGSVSVVPADVDTFSTGGIISVLEHATVPSYSDASPNKEP